MNDLLQESIRYKYLVICNDNVPTLHTSLREMGDAIQLNYSTISKHLANKNYCYISTQDGDYVIKRLNWDIENT